MKKIVMLAVSAILVANLSAQELKKECCKKISKEEKVELDIKRLTNELLLSDKQAEKFAATYRDYAAKVDELFQQSFTAKEEKEKVLTEAELDKLAKQRFENFKNLADLQSKYYDKFRKFLSARQVEKVLQFDEPCGDKPCCGKHEGMKEEKFAGKPEGKFEGQPMRPKHEGPRPEFDRKPVQGPRQAIEPAKQAPKAE